MYAIYNCSNDSLMRQKRVTLWILGTVVLIEHVCVPVTVYLKVVMGTYIHVYMRVDVSMRYVKKIDEVSSSPTNLTT